VSEADDYLHAVAARLRAELGEALTGVYAGGSRALGGYLPSRSDLDVMAVCRGPLHTDAKLRIGDALRHESLPCPARGLELVVYRASTVRAPTSEPGYELDLNTGRAMPFRLSVDPADASGRHWYVIDRAIVREHGFVVDGPASRELFAPIPRETLLRALCEAVRWYECSRDARDDDAVLNACRAWQFVAEGVWSSKPAAGEWARQRLTGTKLDLVADAEAARVGGGELGRERVESFLRFVSALVRREL
jgi:hypothetical protein